VPCAAGRRLARVALDSTAVLGAERGWNLAAAHLRLFTGFWSPWIVAEFVRKRTEWVAYRALREGQTEPAQLRARLAASRARVNDPLRHASEVLRSVDPERAPVADLSWLTDPDDVPVMKTALAARADTLVTDNARDFPLGGVRNGVLILGTGSTTPRSARAATSATARTCGRCAKASASPRRRSRRASVSRCGPSRSGSSGAAAALGGFRAGIAGVDAARLAAHAARRGRVSLRQRAGYLLERAGVPPAVLEPLAAATAPANPVPLAKAGRRPRGRAHPVWRVVDPGA
jgi:hypothetical protein